MKVCEIFKAIQGEGKNVGQSTIFIRFSGCNLSCKWCDTKYNKFEGDELSAIELMEKLEEAGLSSVNNVTLTGGEPLIQNERELLELLGYLKGQRKIVNIETNGTLFSDKIFEVVDFFSISPKLQSSETTKDNYLDGLMKYIDRVMEGYASKIQLKFVVMNDKDIVEAKDILSASSYFKEIFVVFQPCTDYNETADSYSRKAAYLCETLLKDKSLNTYNWRFLLQQHVVIYKNKRGV